MMSTIFFILPVRNKNVTIHRVVTEAAGDNRCLKAEKDDTHTPSDHKVQRLCFSTCCVVGSVLFLIRNLVTKENIK